MYTAKLACLFVCLLQLVLSQNYDIEQPPTFVVTSPKLLIFKENGAVDLECRAIGNPAVDYFWKKNGEKFNTNAANIHSQGDNSIRFSPVTQSDEGFYQCIAENKYGTAFSNITQLRKAVLRPLGPTKLTDQLNTTEGEPFKIPASSFEVQPRSSADYVWRKHSESNKDQSDEISTGPRIQIADNGDLHFAYVLTTDDLDGKLYKSEMRNPGLEITAEGNFTKLTVQPNSSNVVNFPPHLAFASVSRSPAMEGESVTFRCFFYGNPEPKVTWLRSKDTLPADRFTLSNGNTKLTIINVTKSDETFYHCLGTNEEGSQTHNLSLTIEASPPRFLNQTDAPREAYIVEEDSVTFNCNTYATPEASVAWFFNGKSLQDHPRERFAVSDDRKSLKISSVCRECKNKNGDTISDTGVIQCNASNVHGYALGTGFLNVITLKQAAVLNAAPERVQVPYEVSFVVTLTTLVFIFF